MMLKHVQKLGCRIVYRTYCNSASVLCFFANELVTRKWHDLLKSRRDSRRLIALRPSMF